MMKENIHIGCIICMVMPSKSEEERNQQHTHTEKRVNLCNKNKSVQCILDFRMKCKKTTANVIVL